ncbi:MAG: NAD(P)-dependent oxidoreductase [Anaerovoracaceae bacterium]|jgi:lactate dehydrogenase-like 2-hydroxyacid dehydrogenase
MKTIVYNYRADEDKYFKYYSKKLGIELVKVLERPDEKNAHLAEGCDQVTVLTDANVTEPMIRTYAECGVKLITTRTIGADHIDLEAAGKYGVAVSRITYSPYSVADYTIMLILMVLRHVKTIVSRYYGQDYTILGSMGQELPGKTVGLIGGGRIGRAVAKHLSGFGCKILMSDHHPSSELEGIVEYCGQDRIIEESDIISLHVPFTEENAKMINAESISRMKDGVIIINTARGGLVDTGALIDAIESGKVGGAGLDLVDGDRMVYYRDFKDEVISFRDKAILDSFPNVIMMPHMAFYTDQVVDDMIRYTLEDCVKFLNGEELPFRLV